MCVHVFHLCGSLKGWGGHKVSLEQFVLCSMTGWVVSNGTVTGVCSCCLCVPTVIRMWRVEEEMLFENYTEVPPVVTEY